MVLWSENHVKTLIPFLIVMLILAVVLKLWLGKKNVKKHSTECFFYTFNNFLTFFDKIFSSSSFCKPKENKYSSSTLASHIG